MAGLIQNQMMGQDPAAQAQGPAAPPQEQMPVPGVELSPEEQLAEVEADDGSPDPETDPGFQAAMGFAMKALYEEQAAKDIAQSLRQAPDPAQGLAETAYEITSGVDERTDGQVPEELILVLGIQILGEVVQIGEAAGVQYMPSDVASAYKQMLLRYMGEQGMDTSQLQQAMDQISPETFNEAAMADEEE
jgi:hypothetical protein